MKKLLFTILSVIMLLSISNAQSLKSSNVLSFGIPLNFPMGDFSDVASTGWGITGQYELSLGGNWTGTLTTGYLGFAENNGTTYTAIPLTIGAKLYFAGGWYGIAETGFHFYSWDFTNPLTNAIGSDSKTEWGFSLGTGYVIPLSENVGLDLSTKYQYNGDNLSYWNTYVGLMFGL